jgi:hypothetical protein
MAAAAIFGILAGVVLALSFRLFANHAAIRTLRRKLWAHVLELRLFGEDPALAFGSLLRIFKTNALLLAHALPPLAAAAPLVILLALPVKNFCTRTPLEMGRDAVLTVRLRPAFRALPVELRTPAWIAVDAPPVHIPQAREISWRLRAKASGARPDVLLRFVQSRLPRGAIERVWISPLPAPPWLEWFAAAACLTAWLASLALARLRPPRRAPRPSPPSLPLLFGRL